ncbi:MAG: hypothetical protein ACOC10_11380 [Bacteroidota bacterium]
MKVFFIFLIVWGSLILFSACKDGEAESGQEPVVRVADEVLTTKDLKTVLPRDVSGEDSAALADDYVNRWVNNKLFLRQAESNLTEEEQDISQLLDEYRTSLLVNKYQQKMLEQKYSPLLSDEEIEQYYNEMQDNFKLQENVLKGFLIKVPLDSPNLGNLRRWCRSFETHNLSKIEDYSLKHAQMYDTFLDTWVPFQRINANLPEPVRNEERFLQYNSFFEVAGERFRYFLVVVDYKTIGETAPINYVDDRIKAILLNKKRGEFIKSLEKQLYDEALQKKIINFY